MVLKFTENLQSKKKTRVNKSFNLESPRLRRGDSALRSKCFNDYIIT